MKKISSILLAVLLCCGLFGCSAPHEKTQIAATTLPVYEFTAALCDGTGIQVTRLITESVSCLHDYTLQVSQMRAVEAASLVVISGAGLEDFLDDTIPTEKALIDASAGIELLCSETAHSHDHAAEHTHAHDPHIWLSPANAKTMARNIYAGLIQSYPGQEAIFAKNLSALELQFDALSSYAAEQLTSLSCRQLITFHDGFAYMADSFGLSIAHAMEEESGSEASAKELIELTQIVKEHDIHAIFTERNGSVSAAGIIAAETNTPVYSLDMAMAGDSYFDAMYHNIDTLKEALQ